MLRSAPRTSGPSLATYCGDAHRSSRATLMTMVSGKKNWPNHALHRTAAQRVSGQLGRLGGAAVGELNRSAK